MAASHLRVTFPADEITPASPTSSDGYKRLPLKPNGVPAAVAAAPRVQPFTAPALLHYSDSDVDDDPFVGYVMPSRWSTDSPSAFRLEEDADEPLPGLSAAYAASSVADSYDMAAVPWLLLEKEWAAAAAARPPGAPPMLNAAAGPPSSAPQTSDHGSDSDDSDDDPFARPAPRRYANVAAAPPAGLTSAAALDSAATPTAPASGPLGGAATGWDALTLELAKAAPGASASPTGNGLEARGSLRVSRRASGSSMGSDPFARYTPELKPLYDSDDGLVVLHEPPARLRQLQRPIPEADMPAAEDAMAEVPTQDHLLLLTGSSEVAVAPSDVVFSEAEGFEAGAARQDALEAHDAAPPLEEPARRENERSSSPAASTTGGVTSSSSGSTGSSRADTDRGTGAAADHDHDQDDGTLVAGGPPEVGADGGGGGGGGGGGADALSAHSVGAGHPAASVNDGGAGGAGGAEDNKAAGDEVGGEQGAQPRALHAGVEGEPVSVVGEDAAAVEEDVVEDVDVAEGAALPDAVLLDAAVMAVVGVVGEDAAAPAAGEAAQGDEAALVASGDVAADATVAARGSEAGSTARREALAVVGSSQAAASPAGAPPEGVPGEEGSAAADTANPGTHVDTCGLPFVGADAGKEAASNTAPADDRSLLPAPGSKSQLVSEAPHDQPWAQPQAVGGSACSAVKVLRRTLTGSARSESPSQLPSPLPSSRLAVTGTSSPRGSAAASRAGTSNTSADGARRSCGGGGARSSSGVVRPPAAAPADEAADAGTAMAGTPETQRGNTSLVSGSQPSVKPLLATPRRTSSGGSVASAPPAAAAAGAAAPPPTHEGRSRLGRVSGASGVVSAAAATAGSPRTGTDSAAEQERPRSGAPHSAGPTLPHVLPPAPGQAAPKTSKLGTGALSRQASPLPAAPASHAPDPASHAASDAGDGFNSSWLARPEGWRQHLAPQKPPAADRLLSSGGGSGANVGAAPVRKHPAPAPSEAALSIASAPPPRLQSAGASTTRRHPNGLPLRQPTGPLPGMPLLGELASRYPLRQAPAGSPQISLVSGQLCVSGRLFGVLSTGKKGPAQVQPPGTACTQESPNQPKPASAAHGGHAFQDSPYLEQRRAEKAQRSAMVLAQQQRAAGLAAGGAGAGGQPMQQSVWAWGSRPGSDALAAPRGETGAGAGSGAVGQQRAGQWAPGSFGSRLAAAHCAAGGGDAAARRGPDVEPGDKVERWLATQGGPPEDAPSSHIGGPAAVAHSVYGKSVYGKCVSGLWPSGGPPGSSRGPAPRAAISQNRLAPAGAGGGALRAPPPPPSPTAKLKVLSRA